MTDLRLILGDTNINIIEFLNDRNVQETNFIDISTEINNIMNRESDNDFERNLRRTIKVAFIQFCYVHLEQFNEDIFREQREKQLYNNGDLYGLVEIFDKIIKLNSIKKYMFSRFYLTNWTISYGDWLCCTFGLPLICHTGYRHPNFPNRKVILCLPKEEIKWPIFNKITDIKPKFNEIGNISNIFTSYNNEINFPLMINPYNTIEITGPIDYLRLPLLNNLAFFSENIDLHNSKIINTSLTPFDDNEPPNFYVIQLFRYIRPDRPSQKNDIIKIISDCIYNDDDNIKLNEICYQYPYQQRPKPRQLYFVFGYMFPYVRDDPANTTLPKYNNHFILFEDFTIDGVFGAKYERSLADLRNLSQNHQWYNEPKHRIIAEEENKEDKAVDDITNKTSKMNIKKEKNEDE